METSFRDVPAHPWSKKEMEAFTDFIEESLEACKVPGAAVAMVNREGTILYQQTFGVKSLQTQEPVSIDTPFMIGSTTKALTSLLIALLVDKKYLQWDTPLTDLLPEFCTGSEALTKSVTIQASASAATGMPRRDFDFIFRYKGISAEDRLQEMCTMCPTTEENETFQYSNYLYMAGGYAAARSYEATGSLRQAYINAMKNLVLSPLSMTHTIFSLQEAVDLGCAKPHSWTETGAMVEVPLEVEECVESVLPAGGAWSTITDMTRYITMELKEGQIEDSPYISVENLMQRRTPSARIANKMYYGLGLMVQDEQGIEIVQHGGNTMGFSSDMFFLPKSGLGMVILTNRRAGSGFSASIRQKFLELTFSMPSTATKMRGSFVGAYQQMIHMLWEKVSFKPKDLTSIHTLVGSYKSEALGTMEIRESSLGHFQAITKDWTLTIGLEIKEENVHFLVLKESPSDGTFRFLVQSDGSLMLDGGQTNYIFIREL